MSKITDFLKGKPKKVDRDDDIFNYNVNKPDDLRQKENLFLKSIQILVAEARRQGLSMSIISESAKQLSELTGGKFGDYQFYEGLGEELTGFADRIEALIKKHKKDPEIS